MQNQENFVFLFNYYESVKNKTMPVIIKVLEEIQCKTHNHHSHHSQLINCGLMFISLLLIYFGFVSSRMLNSMIFLDVLVDTLKYLQIRNSNPNIDTTEILNQWLMISTVIISTTLLDYFISTGFWLVGMISNIAKCYIYFRLLTDELFHKQLCDAIITFYANNRWGINRLQETYLCSLKMVKNAYEKEISNIILNILQLEKRK